MLTLKAGELAYFDSSSGLVPCKVLSIKGKSAKCARSDQMVTLKLTAARGPYKRGEILQTPAFWAVPRDAIRRTKYSTRIAAYAVECDQGAS